MLAISSSHSLALLSETNDQHEDKCVVVAGTMTYGSSLRAQAVCAASTVGRKQILRLQVQSEEEMDLSAESKAASCPSGFSLVGCSCASSNENCIGASFEDDETCKATLSIPTAFWAAGGRAVASCVLDSAIDLDPRGLPPIVTDSPAPGWCVYPDELSISEQMEKHWLSESAREAIEDQERLFSSMFFFVFLLGGACALFCRQCIHCSMRRYHHSRMTSAAPVQWAVPTTTAHTAIGVPAQYVAPAMPLPSVVAAVPMGPAHAQAVVGTQHQLVEGAALLAPPSAAHASERVTTPLVRAAG